MSALPDSAIGAEARIEAAVVAVLRATAATVVEHIHADACAALGDPGLPFDEVVAALHRLQDADRVLMRCGWYRLSEAERARG